MATVTRPTAGYTPTNPITNATKYQDDSAATSPRVAISSEKVDGDINKAFDVLTDHDDAIVDHETRIDALETAPLVTEFADNAFRVTGSSDATKEVAFEVDGLTTATTRTLTVQNVSGTIYVSGGTDVPLTDGGTGASNASDARTNLGLGSAAVLDAGTSEDDLVQLESGGALPAAVNPIKAWVQFSGVTAGIFGSYNVSSITKNGTGDYTVNFTSAISDSNYCVSGTAQRPSISTTTSLMGLEVRNFNTGSVRVYSKVNNTLEDSPVICVMVVR